MRNWPQYLSKASQKLTCLTPLSSLCLPSSIASEISGIQCQTRAVKMNRSIASFSKFTVCPVHPVPSSTWEQQVACNYKQSNPVLNCKQCSRNVHLLALPNLRCKRADLQSYTSVAMMHSFLSSVITKTDWYIESLGEHIADILHSGFSLCSRSGDFSPKHFSLL